MLASSILQATVFDLEFSVNLETHGKAFDSLGVTYSDPTIPDAFYSDSFISAALARQDLFLNVRIDTNGSATSIANGVSSPFVDHVTPTAIFEFGSVEITGSNLDSYYTDAVANVRNSYSLIKHDQTPSFFHPSFSLLGFGLDGLLISSDFLSYDPSLSWLDAPLSFNMQVFHYISGETEITQPGLLGYIITSNIEAFEFFNGSATLNNLECVSGCATSTVSEPTSLALLILGLASFGFSKKKILG